jgi:hypothetical protein
MIYRPERFILSALMLLYIKLLIKFLHHRRCRKLNLLLREMIFVLLVMAEMQLNGIIKENLL